MKRCKLEFPVYLCILFQGHHTCKLQPDDVLVIVVVTIKLASVCVCVCGWCSGLVYYGTGPRTVIRNKQFKMDVSVAMSSSSIFTLIATYLQLLSPSGGLSLVIQ